MGPALLQLAQTRELTVPRKLGVQGPLVELAKATGETAHVTVLSGNIVYPLTSVESPNHSIRAIMDNHAFPLHATASGLSALAFGPEILQDIALNDMPSFTPNTVTTQQDLLDNIRLTRATGFGMANGSFESEIQGVAAPVFDQTGLFAGSVSVASVATRFTPTLARCVNQNLILASREITRNWGGHIPNFIEAAWATTFSPSNELEAAS
ncbi:IclR family transcriptional regulator C-terminal domain-containing protein [Planktotalea sp.]|uniref:IclR family transcriptional regulator n=1 Tax=Planktotalea sp. TaxID=2029877 RepID=UPI0025E3BEFB|nr:IclR family transcriptional regulator C-terminal domain-containing protein [Planktotalea sp.]